MPTAQAVAYKGGDKMKGNYTVTQHFDNRQRSHVMIFQNAKLLVQNIAVKCVHT